MEVDLEELVISIFSEPPGEPRSRTIAFDTSDLRQLFESLLIIFTNGMKFLYGNSSGVVELENLGEESINLVQQYYESMGYRFFFDIYDDSNENREKTQEMKYSNLTLTSQSRLKDLFFPLLSRGRIYLINFDYI
jgi:hypothetical protein